MVLDVHRDAAADADGEQVGFGAGRWGALRALMLVVGTDEGGLTRPDWEENLANARWLQAVLNRRCPGLCRNLDLRRSASTSTRRPGRCWRSSARPGTRCASHPRRTALCRGTGGADRRAELGCILPTPQRTRRALFRTVLRHFPLKYVRIPAKNVLLSARIPLPVTSPAFQIHPKVSPIKFFSKTSLQIGKDVYNNNCNDNYSCFGAMPMMPVRKHSRKRDAILSCVRGTTCHPTAEWVYRSSSRRSRI